MSKYVFAVLIILINCTQAWAKPLDIVVVGLFSNKAVVQVNQTRHFLKVGETSVEGIKLIAASSQQAVLEVNGKAKTYQLDDQIGGDFGKAAQQPVVSLWPTNGMYLATGNINGFIVGFLVDTGASTIALNAATAARLNIGFKKTGIPVSVKTASGIERAYRVKLDRVQIGEIVEFNVTAIVIDGLQPERALLGMTFLSQLEIHHRGERLDLKQKY